jgi:hypothetical protein
VSCAQRRTTMMIRARGRRGRSGASAPTPSAGGLHRQSSSCRPRRRSAWMPCRKRHVELSSSRRTIYAGGLHSLGRILLFPSRAINAVQDSGSYYTVLSSSHWPRPSCFPRTHRSLPTCPARPPLSYRTLLFCLTHSPGARRVSSCTRACACTLHLSSPRGHSLPAMVIRRRRSGVLRCSPSKSMGN